MGRWPGEIPILRDADACRLPKGCKFRTLFSLQWGILGKLPIVFAVKVLFWVERKDIEI